MKNNLRYGIRKHKLGAASVFLGTMIVVGMGQDKEAAASEQKTTTVEENGNSATDNKTSETQTTATNVNHIEETQSYNATVTEQPSNATQVTTEEAPKAVQAPQTAQPANIETVKEEVVKEEAKPQVKETTQSQDNSGDQRQVDLTPKKATQNQVAETQVEVAQPRTASESKPRVTRSADVAEAKEASNAKVETGTDVTSKVTVEIGSIEGHNNTNKVEPHAGQRAVLKYKLKFENGLHQGDYFDFTLSNNVNTHGVSTARKVPEIKNGSVVMATGEVLEGGKIRYTFTNDIEDKVDVTAELEINLFIDPKTVQTNGNQTITSTLNEEQTSKELDVKYKDGIGNYYANLNGSIETFNKANNRFSHVAFIKPNNGKTTSVTVTGTLMKGSNQNGNQPKVRIFEYLGNNEDIAKSVYANTTDTSKFKEVTSNMSGNLNLQNNGSYSLNIENLDKTYVVHYDGEYLNGTDEVDFRTQMVGHPEQLYKYYYDRGYTLTWDNGLVLYSNKANGNGKNGPIIQNNKFEYKEDTLPKVSGQNEGQQTIEEDTTPPIVPPTPPTPEVPSEPETPTPPTPEVPSEPETPTPPTPEVPSEPETPTPPTPEVPAEPGKPVPPAKEEPKKPSKPVEQGKVVTPVIEINEKVKAVAPTKKPQSKKSELPETGGEESTNKGMLFGGLFSILGLALLRRNKKNHKA
ncbi:TPA: fibrinogen-binding adhesin SdrG C-terminal domain-containing protein [Staphylococcus aureus]|nr:fibrinogen-binding adhesin SdrG C-terminal domain-containing protein [Staphylococcus aureus]